MTKAKARKPQATTAPPEEPPAEEPPPDPAEDRETDPWFPVGDGTPLYEAVWADQKWHPGLLRPAFDVQAMIAASYNLKAG